MTYVLLPVIHLYILLYCGDDIDVVYVVDVVK